MIQIPYNESYYSDVETACRDKFSITTRKSHDHECATLDLVKIFELLQKTLSPYESNSYLVCLTN